MDIFSSNPNFQKLSPEAQQIVKDKFNSLSPQAQQIIQQKLSGAVQQPQKPASMMDVAMNQMRSGIGGAAAQIGALGQDALNKLGEWSATRAAQGGMEPHLAAAGGTLTQMLPDIAMATMPVESAANAIEPLANKAGNAISRGVDLVTGPGKSAAIKASETSLAPLEEQLTNQAMRKDQIPAAIAQKAQMLQGMKAEAGKAMGAAEEASGFGFKEIPEGFNKFLKDPEKVRQLGNLMSKIKGTPVEELSKSVDVKQLQMLRKLSQELENVGTSEVAGITKANIKAGAEQSAKALEKASPEFAKARSRWQDISDTLDNLPAESKARQTELKAAMAKTRLAILQTRRAARVAVEEGATRDQVRSTLFKTAVGGTVGYGVLKHFLQ